MHTDIRHEPAKIYDFPRRTAVTSVALRRDGGSADIVRLQRMPEIDSGAWYHTAAIQDAARTRKP